MRTASLALVALLVLVAPNRAQTPEWRFRWQPGQNLTYKVDHVTTVNQVVDGNKIHTSVKLSLLKRWEVLAVDAQGVASLRFSLQAMRNEQTRPDGEVLLFDSNDLDKSTPELRAQMSKFVGKPLAEIRIDGTGKVLEARQNISSSYEAEPPFVAVLPGSPISVGGNWERNYRITLAPPAGTGEKVAAKQKYECKSITGPLASLSLTTTFARVPESALERVPLVQRQPQGEILFDLVNGRLHSARLTINQTLQNHQGQGSSYHFQSSYNELYVP